MVMRVASFFAFQTSYYLNGHSRHFPSQEGIRPSRCRPRAVPNQWAPDHLGRAQATFAAFQFDFFVDYCRRSGLAKRLDQPGTPAWPVISPVSSSTSISKFSRSASAVPPAPPRVKPTITAEQNWIGDFLAELAESRNH
jgi:hypothetical protein